MADGRENSDERQRSESGGASPAGVGSNRNNAPVPNFLADLAGISSEINQAGHRKASGEYADDNPIPSGMRQTKAPPLFETDEEAHLETRLDLESINREIEKTLVELERLKSKVISITDRRDSKPETSSPSAAEAKQPPAAPAPRPRAKSAAALATRDTEEQAWNTLKIFRAEIAASKSARRRRIFIIILTAAIMAGILGYFYLFRMDKIKPILELIGQVPDSGAKNAGMQILTPVLAETILRLQPTNLVRAGMQRITGASEVEAVRHAPMEHPAMHEDRLSMKKRMEKKIRPSIA